MSADRFPWQAIVRKTGEGHADDPAGGETRLGRRIRELKDNFVRDLMHAISMATADELGELVPAVREQPSGAAQLRSESPKRRERHSSRSGHVSVPIFADGAATERDASSPPPPNDPFDITSPMELLASTEEASWRPAAVQQRPARTAPSILDHPSADESVTSLVDGDKEAASERRPTVVLREGESLLSAAASGIVIRRERRVAPPR